MKKEKTRRMSRRQFIAVTGTVSAALIVGMNGSCKPSPDTGRVALKKVLTYDTNSLRQALAGMFDDIGGLDHIISAGDRVAIKINLTGGGTGAEMVRSAFGLEPGQAHWTHPEVVRAVGELVRDAGAGTIYIIDGVFDGISYANYGYSAVAAALAAELLDLNSPSPYGSFVSYPVGSDWLVYDHFVFNRLINEVDCFISIAKMKCHQNAGVTLGLKNLFGLVPTSAYELNPGDGMRSALHGSGSQYQTRVPRAIVDLARARPIHLSIIDGIKTIEAGEGPWISTANPVAPGVLLAGRDPVAVDAVALAVMGFDPEAATFAAPFLNGENHLALASLRGVGTNQLDDIDVVGDSIAAARYPFTPCLRL